MKKLVIIAVAIALVAGAIAYRTYEEGNWHWERLPLMGTLVGPWDGGGAPIVSLPLDSDTQLAPGKPLDNDGEAEITVVAVPEEPTPVTSSDETLPSGSEITVREGGVVSASSTGTVREVMVPVVTPAGELAGRIALLISAVQTDMPHVPELAADVKRWAVAAEDSVLVTLVAPFEQPAVSVVEEEQATWLDRWVKIKKRVASPMTENRKNQLAALMAHYLEHYASAGKGL